MRNFKIKGVSLLLGGSGFPIICTNKCCIYKAKGMLIARWFLIPIATYIQNIDFRNQGGTSSVWRIRIPISTCTENVDFQNQRDISIARWIGFKIPPLRQMFNFKTNGISLLFGGSSFQFLLGRNNVRFQNKFNVGCENWIMQNVFLKMVCFW